MTGTDRDRALTHLDEQGRARMVDVTGKAVTVRRAVARCSVLTTRPACLAVAEDPDDPLAFARAAGIQAAKRTSELIPLCHPLPLDGIDVRIELGDDSIEVSAEATVCERTGVEMEALTACGVAALTLVMSLFRVDPEARVDALTLWHKSGGRSGTWRRDETTGTMSAVSPRR